MFTHMVHSLMVVQKQVKLLRLLVLMEYSDQRW